MSIVVNSGPIINSPSQLILNVGYGSNISNYPPNDTTHNHFVISGAIGVASGILMGKAGNSTLYSGVDSNSISYLGTDGTEIDFRFGMSYTSANIGTSATSTPVKLTSGGANVTGSGVALNNVSASLISQQNTLTNYSAIFANNTSGTLNTNANGILIQNLAGPSGSQINLDMTQYYSSSTTIPTNRIQCADDGASSAHMIFFTKTPGALNNSLVERMRLTSAGLLLIGTGGIQINSNTIATSGGNLLTLPTSTDTVTTNAATQTLTNKTLTSPAISGGSINNCTVGATTASSGSFTTLAASGAITQSGTTSITSGSSGITCSGPLSITGKITNYNGFSTVGGGVPVCILSYTNGSALSTSPSVNALLTLNPTVNTRYMILATIDVGSYTSGVGASITTSSYTTISGLSYSAGAAFVGYDRTSNSMSVNVATVQQFNPAPVFLSIQSNTSITINCTIASSTIITVVPSVYVYIL